jgi:CRISPR type III-A/MTUBE-associated protein Csm6
MNKTILFSPVGGTDPVSESNMQDGSLIHICRFYKPDTIYLYLSGEMVQKHHDDNRYVYCLERLYESLKKNPEIKPIENPELVNVHDFDYFYAEFLKHIKTLQNEMDETDELLINISSGTPAMKSGLLVLYTLGGLKARLIQVATPVKRMNEHHHSKDLNVQDLWDLNLDNDPAAENRCREITCPTLEVLTKEKIIEQHLRAYDYTAAMTVAKSLKGTSTGYIDFIEAAIMRNSLKYNEARNKFPKEHVKEIFPVLDGKFIKYFEYIQNLIIKFKRNELADFIRAISPIIMDLFLLILQKRAGIDIENDYAFVDKKKILRWDSAKLTGSEIFNILDNSYLSFKSDSEVRSDNLVQIIKHKITDVTIVDLAEDIREVEYRIRNVAAHQIVCIDEDFISSSIDMKPIEVINKLKRLFQYACQSVSNDHWNSYDRMNDFIISQIKG